MGDYGIKVSRDGFDAKTAEIINQSFNSEKNSLKIDITGMIVSSGDGYREVDIAHGLDVTPGFLFWFEVDGNGKWFPGYSRDHESGKGGGVWGGSDETNLVIEVWSDEDASIKVFYMIFIDPGE